MPAECANPGNGVARTKRPFVTFATHNQGRNNWMPFEFGFANGSVNGVKDRAGAARKVKKAGLALPVC